MLYVFDTQPTKLQKEVTKVQKNEKENFGLNFTYFDLFK